MSSGNTNILLIGAGNHLQYSIDIIEKESKYQIIGILDSKEALRGKNLFGYNILGRPEEILDIVKSFKVTSGIVTIGDNWIRKKVSETITSQVPNFKFVNAIHPSVTIGSNVKLGHGVIAMAGCIINPGAILGNFTFLATGAQIEHDCVVDNYASISAGSIMGGHVRVGELSAITLGVTIVDRVSIGRNTVIGAGSLVTKTIPDNVLAYGTPAVIIRKREEGERFLK